MHSSDNSDFVFDYNCLPCARSKRNSEAESYCIDCKSQMCTPCLEAHNRLYSGHKLFGHDTRNTWDLCKNEEDICGKHVRYVLDRNKCSGCEMDDKIKRIKEQHSEVISKMNSRNKSSTDEKLMQQRREIDQKLQPLTGSSYADVWLCLDQARISKCSEEYSELYDNKWTDAFDAIDMIVQKDEYPCIQILLKAFEKTYTAAIRTVDTQRKMICESLGYLQVLLRPSEAVNIPTEVIARQIQCSVIHDTAQAITNTVLKEHIEIYGSAFEQYVKACAELCVQMAISPKPPHVEFHQSPKGTRLDTGIYKHYTKTGSKIEFIVWAPMYLEKDGPLLCKGVAQGMP